jgi:hypothetical protein
MIFEGRKNTASVSLGSASASGHIGMEYRIRDVVSLRSGYEASGLTAGAGIHPPAVSFLGRELYPALDYAFINDSAFGAVHRIGASLAF